LYKKHINFGVSLPFTSQLPEMTDGIMVVIGVILVGFATERQLLSFDCKVVVLQGMNHPGGRVYTQRMGNEGMFAVLGRG